jgi:hypothetical protein
MRTPTSIRSSGGSVGAAIASVAPNAGGKSRGRAISAQEQDPRVRIQLARTPLKASASRPLRR